MSMSSTWNSLTRRRSWDQSRDSSKTGHFVLSTDSEQRWYQRIPLSNLLIHLSFAELASEASVTVNIQKLFFCWVSDVLGSILRNKKSTHP
jgi:hypothetical protein